MSAVLVGLVAGGAWLAATHGPTPYDAELRAAGAARGVPLNLLRAIARVESGFNPSAVGPTGDVGLMQLSPATAARLGLSGSQLRDPAASARGAAQVLAENRATLLAAGRFSALTWAASYNVGPDLEPREAGTAYAGRVLLHWLGYDLALA